MTNRMEVNDFIKKFKDNTGVFDNNFYAEVEGGTCNSLNRITKNDKRVIAYFIFDRLAYVIIDTPTRGYRLYRICLFDYYRRGRGTLSAEQVYKDFNRILDLKFKILDKQGFEEFKRELIVKSMEEQK